MEFQKMSPAVVALYFGALLILFSCAVDAAAKLPSNFKRCKTDDPNLNDCMKEAVDDAFRKMKDGVESLNVPPVDPLKVKGLEFGQGTGPVTINLKLSNVTITGLSETKITEYRAKLDQHTLRCSSFTPSMKLDFHYVMNGRILLLPIRGEGPGNIDLNEVVVEHVLKNKPLKNKKDDQMYWTNDIYNVKIKPKSMKLHFTGLFGTDGRLGDHLNAFLNQHSKLIFEELRVSIEESFGNVFKDITNRVFSRVPYNDIFIVPAEASS